MFLFFDLDFTPILSHSFLFLKFYVQNLNQSRYLMGMQNVCTFLCETSCLNTEWIHSCLHLQLKWEKQEMFRLNCFGGRSIRKVKNWTKNELRTFCSSMDLMYWICFSVVYVYFFFLWHCGPVRVMISFLRFLGHTRRRTTVNGMLSGRMISSSQRPLRDNKQHLQQRAFIPLTGFETAISAGERPQTSPLNRSATGPGY
jgi:hypothetical protein